MGQSLRITSDKLVVEAGTEGGVLLGGWTRQGLPFLRPFVDGEGPEVLRASCFPLVPVGNRVQHNGFELQGRHWSFTPNTDGPWYLHGDGWLGSWQVEEHRADLLRLSFRQSEAAHSPHLYRAEQCFSLEGPVLRMAMEVTNLGQDTLPFGIGFHPYFPRTAGTRLLAPAQGWWPEGPDFLPEAECPPPPEVDFSQLKPLPARRLNNGYRGWSGRARIEWSENGLAVDIAGDAVFSTCMIYAPVEDQQFFCFEPMSHAPNALASEGPRGLHLLAPGETLAGSITLTISEP
ncbi:aldose 1-epimerase [Radicibacter daui]|uniref:aldose 1-epimerase n=1 Tax=Radicibacter daui TaxID=3064829 RepID=UPI004046EFA6